MPRIYFPRTGVVSLAQLHRDIASAYPEIEGIADLVAVSNQVAVDFPSQPSQGTADAVQVIVTAHDGIDDEAVETATDKAALRGAQADQAIADINTALTTANADLAGWDTMTTTDKIAACKRMLSAQIGVLQRQRKIIKYVRWL